MQAFNHHSPESLSEALALISQKEDQRYLIAGGTDLLLKMRAGMLSPATVIDIKRVPELKGIAYDEQDGLKLGALVTLRELTRSAVILELYPSLAQAAGLMASEQIRSFATMGGNLCNAAPSADLAPPLIAFGATAVIAGSNGERRVPLEDFFLGPGQSILESNELLHEVIVPPAEGKTVYLKHAPRAYMDIAVVGVAVRLHQVEGMCRQARIVLAAVAPVPLRVREAEEALEGKQVTAGSINRAAKGAAAACSPIDDVRGSAWYRRHMAEVLTRRGLEMVA